MKEITAPVMGKVSKTRDLTKIVIFELLTFVVGFLLSRTVVSGAFLPLGFAFISALPLTYIFGGLLGVLLGSLSPANGFFPAYYIGLALLATAVKLTFLYVYNSKNSPFFAVLTAFFCNIFGIIALIFSVQLTGADYVRITGEAMLSLGAAYFLSLSLPVFSSPKPLSRMSYQRICAVVMSVGIILMSLADFQILSVVPARIFAMLIILLSAFYGKVSAAAICAVALGFAMSISGTSSPYIALAYALGGLIAGVFGGSGKAFCFVGFLLGNFVVVIGAQGGAAPALHFTEIIISGMLFFALPKTLCKVFLEIFSPPPQLPRVDSMRKNLVTRLKFASNAVSEVSRTVDEIGQRLDERKLPSLDELYDNVTSACCGSCGLNEHCFVTQKGATYKAFCDMTKLFKKRGSIEAADYPEHWAKRCLKPAVIATALGENLAKREERVRAVSRITDIRNIVSSQMDGLSDMLYHMALQFGESEVFDTEAAARIDTALRAVGLAATDISCKVSRHGRVSVEIAAKRQKQSIPKIELMNRISAICGVKFDPPCIVNNNSITLISLSQRANFRVDFGAAQLNPAGVKISGDSYSHFSDGKGNFVMLLSDGMGNGPRAAVDSTFACNLLSRLIKAGFGFECALKFVNSAMIFKGTDESMATVDITAIDLHSGQADFYKAGSPHSLVVMGKKVGLANCNAHPAGILCETEFDRTSAVLQKGNIVVMFSDGVTDREGDFSWLEDEVVALRKNPAQDIAGALAKKALTMRDDKHEDDITVLVAILEEEV